MPLSSGPRWLAVAEPIRMLLRRLVLFGGILGSSRWSQVASTIQPCWAAGLLAGGDPAARNLQSGDRLA